MKGTGNNEARATLYSRIRPTIVSGENGRLAAMSSVLAIGQVDGKAIIPAKWPASSKKTSSSRLNSRRGKNAAQRGTRRLCLLYLSKIATLYATRDQPEITSQMRKSGRWKSLKLNYRTRLMRFTYAATRERTETMRRISFEHIFFIETVLVYNREQDQLENLPVNEIHKDRCR